MIKSFLIKLKRKFLPNKKSFPFNIEPESYDDPLKSQKGQVRFLLEVVFNYKVNGLKRNGYFVDLAAAYPVLSSNSYFLEKHLGWNGLLIEGNPFFADELRSERSSKVIEVVVSSEANKTIQFRIDNGVCGGIIGDNFDNNLITRSSQLKSAKIIDLKTKTLLQILLENNAPKEMDYLSLDVEGAEYECLKNFDFEQFKWRFMTVERPNLELNLLLDEKGYIQVHHERYDTFYVHKDHISSINNKELKSRFLLTPRKNW